MSLFAQTVEGDRARDGFGMLPRVNGAEEATQHVSTRLRIIKGEVFRDTRVGLDSFGTIFKPSASTRAIANHVATIVSGTPGVILPQVQLTAATDGSGQINIDWDAEFNAADQTERRDIHATLTVTNHFGALK